MAPASQAVGFVVVIIEAMPTFPVTDTAIAEFMERADKETFDAKFSGAAII